MPQLLVAYQIGLVVAVLVSAVATGFAWRNRDQRGGTPLAILLAATTVWSSSTLFETIWSGTPLAFHLSRVVLTSVVVLVLSFLLFALSYTSRDDHVTPRLLALLAVEPILFTVLVWTNGSHGLVWRTVEFGGSSFYGLVTEATWVYAAHTLYSYALLATAVVLIVVFALRSRYLYQRQVAAIVVATLVPWFANVVYQLTTIPYDPTPVAFTVTAVAFTWAVVREDFLDITPVATQMVLDTIETGVFVVDVDGRVVDVNERACDLLGVSTQSAVGSAALSLLVDVPRARELYDELSSHRSSTERNFAAEDRYFRIQMSPLFERRDELVGRVFLLVDLTDQHRRETALQRRNDQLDQFAGVVSHDLRNPLDVASSSLQLARETGADEDFDRVERAHERMERLIDDLLTLARQDYEPGTADVDLADAANAAWKYVDTADATLDVSVADQRLEADRDRLIQLFENLYRNAVEHGGEDVTVSVESLPDGFAVADDGRGLDPADFDEIFDEGFTTAADGTGFGLAIVAEITATHGWEVSATESNAGGARFEFRVGESVRS